MLLLAGHRMQKEGGPSGMEVLGVQKGVNLCFGYAEFKEQRGPAEKEDTKWIAGNTKLEQRKEFWR